MNAVRRGVVRITLFVFGLMACSTSTPTDVLKPEPEHHGEGGYVNPYGPPNDKNVFDFIKMRWFSSEPFADHTEELDQIQVAEQLVDLSAVSAPLTVTWLGHSTFLLESNGVRVLTDPILSQRASPIGFVGPERLAPMPYAVEELPAIDYVIISHNHYDHLDAFSIEHLGNQPQYIVPLGLKEWFVDLGIDAARVHELDWWQHWAEGPIRFTATPCQHWSGRGLFDRNQTLWASWMLEWSLNSNSKRTIWFGGDTGYNNVQFKQIGEKWPQVDLALIPIGAYAPRWFMQASHVNPEEAVQIHNDIGSRFSIGMHWSTFQLSAEPLDEPRQKLVEAVASGALEQGEFITLPIGGQVEVD